MTIIILAIGILILGYTIYSDNKKQIKQEQQIEQKLLEIQEIIESQEYKYNIDKMYEFFEDTEKAKQQYFMLQQKQKIKEKYKQTYDFLNKDIFSEINNIQIQIFIKIYNNLDQKVKEWNEKYIQNELEKSKSIFDNIEEKALDEQQRRAVVVDEMNELVIAGAGSGKTLTISGKVKYLVEKKGIKPEEILLISFTKKSAEEMTERIKNKLSINVASSTFHKLGLDIIKEYNQKENIIRQEECNHIINEVLENEDIKKQKIVKEGTLNKVVDDCLQNKIIQDNDNILILQ